MSYGQQYPYGTGCIPPPPPGAVQPPLPAGAVPPPPYSPPGMPGYPPAPGPAQPTVGPFFNPAVPFVTGIPPLQDGTMIYVQGNIPHNCNRFSINLKKEGHEGADNALHVNPRFEGTNQVVRNTMSNGAWGAEERHGGFPLVQGQSFECIVLCTNTTYRIAFNGQHFTEYNHRLPKETVKFLYIEGSVTLTLVRYQPPAGPAHPPVYGGPPPPLAPGHAPPFMNPPAPQVPQTPPVPYTAEFPYGLAPGKTLAINGIPNGNADRFTLDFQLKGGDIAFHFNPRFKDKVVVRNTCSSGNWGWEERSQSHFPFQPGVPFQIIVLCEADKFKVAVNGSHFIEYKHRVKSPFQIKSLYIHGDIQLTSVQI